MVTQRGIEVSPDQIKAIMETPAPSCKKELQRLTTNATKWTSDYEQAFGKIKCYLTQPPILSSPQPSEQLYMYLEVLQTQFADSLKEGWWMLHVDGASKVSGSGIGLLFQSSTGEQLEHAIQLGFPVSNNEAEYEAILVELSLALTLSTAKLKICNNS
ncbi:hypothetical protein AAG906_016825 [Vitis piasezkii]